jgi:hypothetical protein
LFPRNHIQLAAKNVSIHEVLKLTKAEWDTGFPFRPKKFINQYPANSRKTPKIAGFQRGLSPFGFFLLALWRAFFVNCDLTIALRAVSPTGRET